MLKVLNYVIVFLLEVVMAYSFAVFGYSRGTDSFSRYAWAAAFAIGCIVLWAILAAPKSGYRLPIPYLFIFRGVMFLFTAFFLYVLQLRGIAVTIAVLAVVTQVVSFFTETT
jgi:hypothetical protein